MPNQRYCKPYRFNIDIETCKSRLLIINKEHKQHGLNGLTKDQKKCWECQGNTETSPESEEPICSVCEIKASEVSRFHKQLKMCSRCYQSEYRKSIATIAVKA